MIVPSFALANKEMTIATEGDPTDGLGATGGGSGFVGNQENVSTESPDVDLNNWLVFSNVIVIQDRGAWVIFLEIGDYRDDYQSRLNKNLHSLLRGAKN
jgi:hypothetical protein